MALRDFPMLNGTVKPTAGPYKDSPKNQLTLGSAPGEELLWVMPDPGGAGDQGFSGIIKVPKGYNAAANGEKIIFNAILDGAPGATTLAIGVTLAHIADDGSYDVAQGTQRLFSESSVSQADEDHYEAEIDISAETFVEGELLRYFFFIDDSVHTYTGQFLAAELALRVDIT